MSMFIVLSLGVIVFVLVNTPRLLLSLKKTSVICGIKKMECRMEVNKYILLFEYSQGAMVIEIFVP